MEVDELFPSFFPRWAEGDPDYGIDWLRTEATCKNLGLDLLSISEGRISVIRPDGVAAVVLSDVAGVSAWLGPTPEACVQWPPAVGYDLGRRLATGSRWVQNDIDAALGDIARWRPKFDLTEMR